MTAVNSPDADSNTRKRYPNTTMAIFSRRTIQRLVSENAEFLKRKQLRAHVKKLNEGDLSAEWEVVLLNIFSKLGKVAHERNFNGKNPDLYFTSTDHTLEFLADIKTVSDEGLELKNPQKQLSDRLHDEVAKHGIRGAWGCAIGGDFEQARKTGSMVQLKLPALSRFNKEIFNDSWQVFVSQIKKQPDKERKYEIKTETIDISISYKPSERWTGSGGYPSYKSMMAREHLIQNSVWNGLVSKSAQLKATGYEGTLGIILCDGGTEFLKKGRNIIHEFFRTHPAIDFVLALEVVQNFGRHNSNQVMIYFEKSRELPKGLEDFLSKLPKLTESLFPYPERSAINAINALNSTKKHIGASHYGGATMTGNEIRVSSRTVLDLLAGRITYEDFPETYKGFFHSMACEGRLVDAVRIERDTYEQDDDWLIFGFGEPDPAVTPYNVPTAREP